MENFQLSLLFKIIGFGSASGLVYYEDKLYIISDNSTYLYEYEIAEERLNRIALTENAQDFVPKKEKADLEAITRKGNTMAIIGSGSTERRNRIFTYNLKSKKVKEKDFSISYQKMKAELNISDDELNIEGVVMAHEKIYFFQRGNGSNGKNGIIYTDDDIENTKFTFIPLALPKIKNVEATFTDAVLVNDKIYFLAAAEDTTSTYNDGEVLGSLIGCLDLQTLTLEFTQQISARQKFEGLTLFRETPAQLEFLLCEDDDTETPETIIYKLVLHKTR